MINHLQILHQLDRKIESKRWQNKRSFQFRQTNLVAGIGAYGFMASIQQYHFPKTAWPSFFHNQEMLFSQLKHLPSQQTFELHRSDDISALHIFNFYPLWLKPVLAKQGIPPHITLYLKPYSPILEEITTHFAPQKAIWGYEIEQKRGTPTIFQSGPGLFEFSAELFHPQPSRKTLTLYFIASERAKALLRIGGRHWLFPTLKKIAHTPHVLTPLAHALLLQIEYGLLNIHNRVHQEWVAALVSEI